MPRLFLDNTSAPRPAELFRTLNEETYRRAYEEGQNLSQYLEVLDPSDEYSPGDPLGQMDAFERQAMMGGFRFNALRSHGLPASTLEEVCEGENEEQGRALVPEFIARNWRAVTHRFDPEFRSALLSSGDAVLGTAQNPYNDLAGVAVVSRFSPPIPLDRILARTEQIKGDTWRQQYIVDTANTANYEMRRVPEGTEIPATKIIEGQRDGRAYKYGRRIDATYEALRRLPMDRIAFIVGRIAIKAEVGKASKVISVIINGDGNSGTAARVVPVTALDAALVGHTPGISYAAYLGYLLEPGNDYSLNTILLRKDVLQSVALLPVAVGGQLPLGAIGRGGGFGSLTPINPDNPDVQWGITTDAPANKIVGFDANLAIARYTEIGGTISEVAKFIKDQTETLTLTEVEGYAVDDQNASIVLDLAS